MIAGACEGPESWRLTCISRVTMRRKPGAAGDEFIIRHGIGSEPHCHPDYNQSRNGNALSELVILILPEVTVSHVG